MKGLLSHDRQSNDSNDIGKTFQRWINYLGGKSVNGLPVMFPDENAVPYHIYYRVLNTKNYGIPLATEKFGEVYFVTVKKMVKSIGYFRVEVRN